MLSVLSIKNFALIESLEINFSDNLSIITGETGAGKSILLGALGMILGKRADLNSLKKKDEKCIIEASFQVANYDLQNLFETLDIDYEDNTIIRREILPSGKSRAFVNDSPVNLSALQELGTALIDIHSQHQTQELSDENYQLQILDAVANNKDLLAEYREKLKFYKNSKTSLNKKIEQQSEFVKEQDYNNFLLEELQKAQLKAGEQQLLEADFEKLNNVEFVKESLAKTLSYLNEEQIGVLDNINEVRNSLQKISSLSNNYLELYERINSVEIELSDIVSEIENETEGLINDPEQLTVINDKLQQIYSLQKKHQVQTVEELISIEEDLNNKVFLANDLDEAIEKLQQEIVKQEEELRDISSQLSKNRQAAIPILQKQLLEMLKMLGMPNAGFKFDIQASKTFLNNGMDELQLLFSANKGMEYGLLKKVASGGELSRIMLTIKAILAEYSNLPTIIFDEIDTGVSGEIADKMGVIMQNMSKKMQVFAITHLPQIAAKGNQHYKVFKTTQGDSTISQLKLLNQQERVVEIAQMLSGKDISESALKHADELLNS